MHAESNLRKLTAQLEQRVTERTLQLEDINRELEAFSYSISHDLRAPLRQVDSFALILQEEYFEQGSPKALELTQRIRAAVKRMNSLVDALLTLAHIATSDLKRKPVDLSELVHMAAAELELSDPSRKVEWTIADGVFVDADPQLLRVVVDNLLSNAWKFTAQREHAHIEFGIARQTDGSVAFFERDDGAGFDMAYADNLFGAFQRLHSNNEFPGTGIGLATVQRIIHRHGGRIWAEATVDRGATFWFTLTDDLHEPKNAIGSVKAKVNRVSSTTAAVTS